jgi:23S rRNA pseudouridine1911/1915/1917 synthase
MYEHDDEDDVAVDDEELDQPHVATNRVSVAIGEDEAGQRADQALAALLSGVSRSQVQRLIRDGQVHLADGASGEPARVLSKASEVLPVGTTLLVDLPAPVASEATPEDIPLDILFEDEHLVVVNKAAGMVVHPAAGHADGTLVNALIAHCGASLSGIGGVKRPGIVHRLDKDTTGLLVVAKTDRAHQGLAEQFAAHGADGRLERRYLAIVWGTPERTRGTIDANLARSHANRTKIAVVGAEAGRRAVTRYEVLATYPRGAKQGSASEPIASLLALTLETGRTHQVRAHPPISVIPCSAT